MSLFDPIEAEVTETKRGIPGAQLVKQHAIVMATELMAKIPSGDDEFLSQIKESQTSTSALDKLVQSEFGERLIVDGVADFDHEEVQKLLKSFQSNRSRRKNMAMTQANYVELLTAAISEWIVRTSCGLGKSSVPFGGARAAALEINEDTVAALAQDQAALGKAIRNVQSKKSTFKAKHADVDYEDDPAWQELLRQEAMLKGARVNRTGTGSRRGLSVKKALQYIFDGVAETDALGKDESHQIIEACRNLADGVYPEGFIALVAELNAQKAVEEAAEVPASDDVYAD